MNDWTIAEEVLKEIAAPVTTISKSGGIGIGYTLPSELIKGPNTIAWVSDGNGFYSPKEFTHIEDDGGQRYMNIVRGV